MLKVQPPCYFCQHATRKKLFLPVTFLQTNSSGRKTLRRIRQCCEWFVSSNLLRFHPTPPCAPGGRAPAPWPSGCRGSRTAPPSFWRWCFPAPGSAVTGSGGLTGRFIPPTPAVCDYALGTALTCGTSMLSVGRMVASLLLRGSNSKAAVRTMISPETRGWRRSFCF